MAGWYVALVLYLLPVLDGIVHLEEEIEDCKEWMRENDAWFPSIAPMMVFLSVVLWPAVYVASIIWRPR